VDQDLAAVERLLVVVRTEARAWADPQPRARQPVNVEFPSAVYSRLQAISKGIMLSNKRTIGVPRLVRAIVEAWLRKEVGPKATSAITPTPGPDPKPELL
jgi:hypothetical protein